jgi:hypothetical protein
MRALRFSPSQTPILNRGMGVCGVLTRLGVRRSPAERAGGKKRGPSEVVDDGPRVSA